MLGMVNNGGLKDWRITGVHGNKLDLIQWTLVHMDSEFMLFRSTEVEGYTTMLVMMQHVLSVEATSP